ncbi:MULTISPECIES: flagellar biosynthesis protein FliQ [unclassified Sporosarcina]|uniref:flagellar biosynthesis protein FliQ n=1 Tax=unclassified Sporosarcina TaxID=2647733 RepID=UPI000C170C91|nr:MULTISPECIES: flagellar biosynthesis protein FliQ [unclassified Sporosarcina]PIC87634.1 flagellar biosynthetic protein FliQ [Sporosarcina sp. P20a]PID00174.1 flagellar biosynthetic protein FliQ [Sporosarcina sp. P29]PID06857.1 flagellar biosynthetic protein FliQ [Sporosarcina sp. P30]PID10052.1 flagellar biosynthetic protein FliQ [Sporosarcina sp. P31]PID13630.1 flagellar biosynthetic protein FliQ [Sporosarcina sp. P32b]
MTSEFVISIAERSVWVILLASGPLLIVALVTGLAVSIFQATTQIQEQTLAFVPKIVAVMVAIIFFGPWMLSYVTGYASEIFSNLSRYVG